jgi:hypothetical protein
MLAASGLIVLAEPPPPRPTRTPPTPEQEAEAERRRQRQQEEAERLRQERAFVAMLEALAQDAQEHALLQALVADFAVRHDRARRREVCRARGKSAKAKARRQRRRKTRGRR